MKRRSWGIAKHFREVVQYQPMFTEREDPKLKSEMAMEYTKGWIVELTGDPD